MEAVPKSSLIDWAGREGFGTGRCLSSPMIEAASVGGLFRISAISLDRLPQPLHGEFDVLRLQMAPALDLRLVSVLREALEIFRSELLGGRALPGELLSDERVSGHGAIEAQPAAFGKSSISWVISLS